MRSPAAVPGGLRVGDVRRDGAGHQDHVPHTVAEKASGGAGIAAAPGGAHDREVVESDYVCEPRQGYRIVDHAVREERRAAQSRTIRRDEPEAQFASRVVERTSGQ